MIGNMHKKVTQYNQLLIKVGLDTGDHAFKPLPELFEIRQEVMLVLESWLKVLSLKRYDIFTERVRLDISYAKFRRKVIATLKALHKCFENCELVYGKLLVELEEYVKLEQGEYRVVNIEIETSFRYLD